MRSDRVPPDFPGWTKPSVSLAVSALMVVVGLITLIQVDLSEIDAVWQSVIFVVLGGSFLFVAARLLIWTRKFWIATAFRVENFGALQSDLNTAEEESIRLRGRVKDMHNQIANIAVGRSRLEVVDRPIRAAVIEGDVLRIVIDDHEVELIGTGLRLFAIDPHDHYEFGILETCEDRTGDNLCQAFVETNDPMFLKKIKSSAVERVPYSGNAVARQFVLRHGQSDSDSAKGSMK